MNVSIAMATYIGEKYLREQLASLARQTYPTYELVVSDDGSGDGTLGVLAEFRKHVKVPCYYFGEYPAAWVHGQFLARSEALWRRLHCLFGPGRCLGAS